MYNKDFLITTEVPGKQQNPVFNLLIDTSEIEQILRVPHGSLAREVQQAGDQGTMGVTPDLDHWKPLSLAQAAELMKKEPKELHNSTHYFLGVHPYSPLRSNKKDGMSTEHIWLGVILALVIVLGLIAAFGNVL